MELSKVSEDQIRNYAHQLWEKAGKPEGRHDEFWHAAESELAAEDKNPDAANQPNEKTVPG